jgi:hypothetical protein
VSPSHTEKTGSFFVYPKTQKFHCYGCGEHGDAFDFVRLVERVDFPEAKRILAARAGIDLDTDRQSPEERAASTAQREEIKRALPAARFWRRAAMDMGEQVLTLLKAGLFDPTMSAPEVGEIAEWTRRLAFWKRIEGADLVAEYRRWLDRDARFVEAMILAAETQETTARRAAKAFVNQNAGMAIVGKGMIA